VDWRTVAIRTRVSGFDRRRIKGRDTEILRYALPRNGPWLRRTPFVPEPLYAAAGFLDLAVSAEPDSLVSPYGDFRFALAAFAWFPWDSGD
jgi:hypothetical protein